jgi:hypothetical protein
VLPLAIAIAASNIFQLMTYATETRQDNDASRRVIVAGSDLVRSGSPIFAAQLPEPLLAPDLTTNDLRSRRLDSAFRDVMPTPVDRLTASLNLQIRVAQDRDAVTSSTCRPVHTRQITVLTSRGTTPTFEVSVDSTATFTLQERGSGSARRMIDLVHGTYQISSVREAAVLTIETKSPSSLLAKC